MGGPFTGPVAREAIVARIRAHPLGDTAPAQRAAFAQLVLGDDSGRTRPGAPVDECPVGERLGCLVYLHGGGYAFGSPATHGRIGHGLAQRAGLQLCMPAYPLAPEQRWPAQLQAAEAAVEHLQGPLVLAGDSAGGHLALVLALRLALRGRRVTGLLLFSPNTDRSGLSHTRARNAPHDPMVDDAGDRRLALQCFGELPVDHPDVSPVLADLSLLPPLYIEAGSTEVLLGDSLILADRTRQAGVAVTLHVEPDGLHMGQIWAPWWATASASLDRAASFARSIVEPKT